MSHGQHGSDATRFGPEPTGHSRRFALWAPGVETLTLKLAPSKGASFSSHTMHDDGEGWFSVDADCAPGALYLFQLPDGRELPDPASRAQDDDVFGASVVIDHATYQWQNAEWHGRPWAETVILEVHAGVLGGFSGVRSYLAQWAALGITAIELMPVNAVPGTRNWGYDGVLPFAVESSYGTPDDFKALIDEAHGLGLMVFLDVVYNHFGPDGNVWPAFAPSFFTGRDTPWGNAIDFDNPNVSAFFIENALMWVNDYRLDGLRFDAVHAIDNDGFLNTLSEKLQAAAGERRHLHLMLENERNSASLLETAYTAQWNDDVHNVLHHLLTGEQEGYYSEYAHAPTEKLARALASGFVFQGHETNDGTPRGESSSHLTPTAFINFLQNHDQIGNRALGERLITLTDGQALHAATALLLLTPMIPMLFMGEECGARQPFLFFTDHRGELADAVREGRRAEFAAFSAFDSKTARNAIPDPNEPGTFAASFPYDQPDENWAARYKTLLSLRHQHIMPYLADCRFGEARVLGDGAVVASWHLAEGRQLTVAVNLGCDDVEFSLTRAGLLYQTGDVGESGALSPNSCTVWLEHTS
ncbi:malto-oligosyltrehalose trehalohydrolase [Larsenimonas salina]|uniref:malto-oligosyltrehalose trehalohydrolase n=1 Tax=Larsenimonas salina TaxID=1295565 RepID=UPI0020749228|nr:malto-oligosyltrehalose trehalohydrolase [Larsenimonas salina]MCM5703868.1 malto-oligosyltrehalose trehalohydrolase [Larsenimonas salina]